MQKRAPVYYYSVLIQCLEGFNTIPRMRLRHKTELNAIQPCEIYFDELRNGDGAV